MNLKVSHAGVQASSHLIAVVTAATVVGVSSLMGASALPLPLDPEDPAVSQLWKNPNARADDDTTDVELEILGFEQSGDALTIGVGEELAAKVKVSNRTSDELSTITMSVQRQQAAPDVASARVALAADDHAYPYYATNMVLGETLAPGESTETTLRIPTDAAEAVTLAITEPGAYPVRIALSGQLDGVASHLDSQRFLLPVTGTGNSTENSTDTDTARTPTTMLYPISAQTHVLSGETGEAPEDPPLLMSSDELAGELTADGRLSKLIDAFSTSSPQVRSASCLAVDPQLLSVIERMTGGYTIAEQRVSSVRQNQRLRDLWTSSNKPTEGTPGTGADDAAVFLTKLRGAASENCTVALPWANTDLNAVGATGNQWLMREALQRGNFTIEEVLGVTPMTNVVIPGSGYIDQPTATNLGWADTPGTDTPLEQTWELHADTQGPATENSNQTALDNPTITRTAALAPETPVSVLVADNTVWRAPTADRFHQLAPGITGVSYQGSLSATLATLGSAPETVGYGNAESRYDHSMDSARARTLTGQAALRLTVGNGDGESPVLVIPSTTIDATDATMLLDTTDALMRSGAAQPFSLEQYLTANAEQTAELATAVSISGMPDASSFGAPYDDPSQVTETEVLRVTQQATYIDDLTGIMVNDPAIALTRYGFTAPLRQDLLRAMTLNNRRSLFLHAEATSEADHMLGDNRDALQQLRSSVALLPPGNVYTRTSSSSPLIIVAQNGLPLPTETQILYSGPADAKVNTPGVVRIPALGSITLQMTADLPDDNQRTDLTVWLASPDGATISDPVEISVQPRPNVTGTLGIMALGIAALGALLVFRVFRIRRKKSTVATPRRADRSMRDGSGRKGRRQASLRSSRRSPRQVPRGQGRADDGSGSPKPPGSN